MEILDLDTKIIVKKAIEGDESSYKALYTKYVRAMYNICLRLLNNKEDAEDVLQDSFVTAFKKLPDLKDVSTFGGWLRKIVINNCLQHGRKEKLKFEEFDEDEEIEEEDGNWMNEVEPAEVHFAIKNLPGGCRKIFLLYTSENYMHKEIAALLDIAESTSKSQYLRAKKLLQLQLKKRYG